MKMTFISLSHYFILVPTLLQYYVSPQSLNSSYLLRFSHIQFLLIYFYLILTVSGSLGNWLFTTKHLDCVL